MPATILELAGTALVGLGALVGAYARITSRVAKLEAQVDDTDDELRMVRESLPSMYKSTNDILIALARVEERLKIKEDHTALLNGSHLTRKRCSRGRQRCLSS